jgi:voltage-gated potassium channel
MASFESAIEPAPATAGGELRQAVMVTAAFAFLVIGGAVLPHGDSAEAFLLWLSSHPLFHEVLGGFWALIVLEGVAGLFLSRQTWGVRLRRFFLVSLVPPLRMTLAVDTPSHWLWVPGKGWRHTGDEISERLEQRLALPMLVLTLLILPVLGAEFTAGETLENRPQLATAIHLVTTTIWIGFTAEFIWMVSATRQKWAYCVKNWINLVIILLPVVAFLRVLNIFRFARVLRAGKLLRAYRLRTLQVRLVRLALLFNLVERLQQRNPTKYCASLEKKISNLEDEVDRLKQKLETFREKSLKND